MENLLLFTVLQLQTIDVILIHTILSFIFKGVTTMFTIQYKGFYINCYCDKDECRIVYKAFQHQCKSLHAAKIWIAKFLKD